MTSLAEIKGMGTTTPQRRGLSLAEIKGKTTSTPSVMPEPVQQPGFLKSLVMGTGIPRLAANVVRAAQIAIPGGYTSKDFEKNPAAPVNMPWLGQVKPVGLEGTVGQRAKDTLGESLKLASTVVPIGGTVANVGKATLAGKVGRGFVQGAMGGAVGGSMYGLGEGLQQEDATIGSVLSSTAKGGVLGGVTGGVLGGALPAVGAGVRGILNLATNKGRTNTASNIMQRVARVNALDQQKFRDITGKEVGQYLTERGIYGSPEDIAAQLGMRWKVSRDTADAALAKIDGKFQGNALNSALKWLITREKKVSSPGAASQNLRLVTKLSEKHRSEGLNMAEINEVKRLFEKNIRINYSRGASPNPDIVAKATTLDDALRKWQFKNAKGAGLSNLNEINKETQAAYTLAKALEKKLQRSKGNNAVSLTDWIVLSNGDPNAVAAFFAKKALSSSDIQSSVASKLAGTPTVAMPTPKSGPVMGAIEGRTMQPQLQPAQTVLPKSLPTVKPQYNFPSSKLSTVERRPVSLPNTTTKGGWLDALLPQPSGDGKVRTAREGGHIRNMFVRDEMSKYVPSNPRGRNLASEAQLLFGVFADVPTTNPAAYNVVRTYLSAPGGAGINRTELATALDILRGEAEKKADKK